MPTSDMIRLGIRDRSRQERPQAASKAETSRRERSTRAGGHTSQPHKGQWTVDSVKGTTLLTSPKNQTIFSQGETADAVFSIQTGRVKLTVVSPEGKEAVVAILERGAFFGESCLTGQPKRTATATTLEDSTLVRLDKDVMIHVLSGKPALAKYFMSYLLAHTTRIEADLVDQLLNASEKRLARILLSLTHLENDGRTEAVLPKLSQDTLAAMIGTTRSRVSLFMNRFRNLGYIDYGYNNQIRVRTSLSTVLLHD
jgi:CRP/FNR family cyclic AMP-dependent transcriptional regulator